MVGTGNGGDLGVVDPQASLLPSRFLLPPFLLDHSPPRAFPGGSGPHF